MCSSLLIPLIWFTIYPVGCMFLSRITLSLLCVCLFSLSLIEPGPVHTEFEAKMIQDVKQKEYPGADPDTVHYFKNVYLPSSVDIFETLGQTPDDIARVSSQAVCLTVSQPLSASLTTNLFLSILLLSTVHQESD